MRGQEIFASASEKERPPAFVNYFPLPLWTSFEDLESGNTVAILLSRVLILENRDGLHLGGAVRERWKLKTYKAIRLPAKKQQIIFSISMSHTIFEHNFTKEKLFI